MCSYAVSRLPTGASQIWCSVGALLTLIAALPLSSLLKPDRVGPPRISGQSQLARPTATAAASTVREYTRNAFLRHMISPFSLPVVAVTERATIARLHWNRE